MVRKFQYCGLLVLGALLTGCGGTSLGDQISIFLDPHEQTATVEVKMSDGLEVHLDGEFPIANGYGLLSFVPATKKENARIRIEFDLNQIVNDQLGGYQVMSRLPNDAPFPVAMTPPLVRIPVVDKGSVTASALAAVVPELQVGALIGIAQFKTQYFPQGVAICQNFRNQQGYAYAAICLYGPSARESGGIFLGGNFGEVFDSQELLATSSANRTLMAVQRSQSINPLDQLKRIHVNSWSWDEQRYDPRRDLSGSKGQKALDNAKKILKARVKR